MSSISEVNLEHLRCPASAGSGGGAGNGTEASDSNSAFDTTRAGANVNDVAAMEALPAVIREEADDVRAAQGALDVARAAGLPADILAQLQAEVDRRLAQQEVEPDVPGPALVPVELERNLSDNSQKVLAEIVSAAAASNGGTNGAGGSSEDLV